MNQFLSGAAGVRDGLRRQRERQQALEQARADQADSQAQYEAREAARQAAIDLARLGPESPARCTAEQRRERAEPVREQLRQVTSLQRQLDNAGGHLAGEIDTHVRAGDLDAALLTAAKAGAVDRVASSIEREAKRLRLELTKWDW